MPSPSAATSGASMSHPLDPGGPFARFADGLLAAELPDLPADRRVATVAFVCRRARQIPAPLRLGVTTIAFGVGVGERWPGPERTGSFLRTTRLPLVGELARLVRSLGFTFVWETWPDTAPSGASR